MGSRGTNVHENANACPPTPKNEARGVLGPAWALRFRRRPTFLCEGGVLNGAQTKKRGQAPGGKKTV